MDIHRLLWAILMALIIWLVALRLLSAETRITSIRYEPAAGERYAEFDYPLVVTNYITNDFMFPRILTNVVANCSGTWAGLARRVTLRWNGEAGTNYVIETSSSLIVRPITNGWEGDRWRPCSLMITGVNGSMDWTSGAPYQAANFRIRAFSQ